MLWFLFTFIFIFAVISFISKDPEENSFDRSYRCIRECFWRLATGFPVYRQSF